MADLAQATDELFGRRYNAHGSSDHVTPFTMQYDTSSRELSVLSPGLLHLEYGDDHDHVFLVTVHVVPRVAIELNRPVAVGKVSGHEVHLVNAALANHLELTFELTEDQTAGADPQFDDSSVGPDGPAWPADLIMHLTISVADDMGTVYGFSSGEAGGPGRERAAKRRYLPLPPPQARRLTLSVTSPGGPVSVIDLPLPAP